MKRKMLLFTLVFPAILSQNVQAQTGSRLIAQSDWVNNGVVFSPVDSSNYSYSGSRGGDLTHTLKYDNGTVMAFADSVGGYVNESNYIQTFDANNNITSIIYQYWNGGSWTPSSSTLYGYNSSNQMDTMTLQTWGGSAFSPVSQDVYSYNAAGVKYLDVYSTWDAGSSAFDEVSQKTYIYDPTNTYVVNETDEAFVAGSPVYTNQYAYSYSGSQLQSLTVSTWSGSWVPVSMTSYTYDGTGDVLTKAVTVWNPDAGAFVNDSQYVYTYSGSAVPSSSVIQLGADTGSGGWANIMQYVYTYNSYNQLTSSTGTAWNVLGIFEHANGDPMANYYYESFAVSVKNISNVGGDVNIYPVPAQNTLHIDLTWAQAQTATISIYDMQGSVVRQWNATNGTQYNSAIPVNNLADGTYFVKINGQQGEIVKQVVIGH